MVRRKQSHPQRRPSTHVYNHNPNRSRYPNHLRGLAYREIGQARGVTTKYRGNQEIYNAGKRAGFRQMMEGALPWVRYGFVRGQQINSGPRNRAWNRGVGKRTGKARMSGYKTCENTRKKWESEYDPDAEL